MYIQYIKAILLHDVFRSMVGRFAVIWHQARQTGRGQPPGNRLLPRRPIHRRSIRRGRSHFRAMQERFQNGEVRVAGIEPGLSEESACWPRLTIGLTWLARCSCFDSSSSSNIPSTSGIRCLDRRRIGAPAQLAYKASHSLPALWPKMPSAVCRLL